MAIELELLLTTTKTDSTRTRTRTIIDNYKNRLNQHHQDHDALTWLKESAARGKAAYSSTFKNVPMSLYKHTRMCQEGNCTHHTATLTQPTAEAVGRTRGLVRLRVGTAPKGASSNGSVMISRAWFAQSTADRRSVEAAVARRRCRRRRRSRCRRRRGSRRRSRCHRRSRGCLHRAAAGASDSGRARSRAAPRCWPKTVLRAMLGTTGEGGEKCFFEKPSTTEVPCWPLRASLPRTYRLQSTADPQLSQWANHIKGAHCFRCAAAVVGAAGAAAGYTVATVVAAVAAAAAVAVSVTVVPMTGCTRVPRHVHELPCPPHAGAKPHKNAWGQSAHCRDAPAVALILAPLQLPG